MTPFRDQFATNSLWRAICKKMSHTLRDPARLPLAIKPELTAQCYPAQHDLLCEEVCQWWLTPTEGWIYAKYTLSLKKPLYKHAGQGGWEWLSALPDVPP